MSEKVPRTQTSKEIVLGSPVMPPGVGGAHISIDPDSSVRIAAGAEDPSGNRNSLSVTRDSGTVVVGPVTFATEPHNIRIGNQNVFNDALASGIPSTCATPLPTLNFVDSASLVKGVTDTIKGAVQLMTTMAGLLKG